YSVKRLDTSATSVATSTNAVGFTFTATDADTMMKASGKTISIPIQVDGRLDNSAKSLTTVLDTLVNASTGVVTTSATAGTVFAYTTVVLKQISTSTPGPTMCNGTPTAATDRKVVAAGTSTRTGGQYWCLTLSYNG